jgi:hypothetical protein
MRSPTCLIPMLLATTAILTAALPLTPFQATRRGRSSGRAGRARLWESCA